MYDRVKHIKMLIEYSLPGYKFHFDFKYNKNYVLLAELTSNRKMCKIYEDRYELFGSCEPLSRMFDLIYSNTIKFV